jgi:hypothetical protein
MKIGQILKEQQPDIHNKLNKKKYKKKKRKPRERKPKKDDLSFISWDRMMRERTDIDETKCRGR